MATISQGILGGFSGKVGTVIGGFWKGIAYMRSIPASVSQPNTPAQLAQRAKFAAVVQFLQPLTAYLRIGFKNQAIKMSAFNAASSDHLENAISGVYPNFVIDYSKAMVSRGNLPGALNPDIDATTPSRVDFTWENNAVDGNAKANDKVMAVVYNALKGQVVTVVGGNTRASGSQSILLPASFTGDDVQCFIGFQSATESVVSNSQFVGEIVVV